MKQVFRLVHDQARKGAARAIADAPEGWIVEIKEPTRTLEQNALLWAALTDVSRQVEWYGRKLKQEDWKHVFTASLSRQDVVPGLDGGFVVLGKSTSRMSKREMSDLMELIFAFGAENGVAFNEQEV
jgi:hypothetical protein